ncbi:intraflagellar transport protein 81 homolog [Amphibalanus amphitrite]|uniref:intraflagellar transport protein 81 homolog n=1 Tax=Amphibalanus amphitrite TaxID=1232801 RepID=UPI001C90705F|nr:intraflagellar transport protein 81 homolog [Amphibalanus amphitrite]XP_043230235.1 intraflagellar transport protein 81 homolog [Amphibalanus amphitrite]XP_043230237.1 intraflagellar transport protein 81 homolog [Amphibalanus amphitrite]XP_043230238.1 intraflagellar transport protein 81 homolog [Amphibalanus amphitrite]XP_043230239.1 intraflagellar transport protein 81 homolog [Amphibalanus amphitrite]XP_043230240.1 intraflagellar transport protein 81 homolog [Amphibalanus amphitrite]XP_04
MNEKLKVIVEELGKDPFNKKYNVISFDALGSEQLLQALNDVFAEIDSQHAIDLREEPPEETVMRMLAFLRILKYQPQADPSSFRQGLVSGEKYIIYPILEWCLLKLPDLKKRAYLARYLVKIEIPGDILTDPELDVMYRQYEDLIEEFKATHKEYEALRNSVFQTAELRKDIAAMEEEREIVTKKIERLKNKVEGHPNKDVLLESARRLRLEKDREQELANQKIEQEQAIARADQRLARLQGQLKDLRSASMGTTPEALIQRLEEDVKVHSYLATEKMPKELEVKKKQVANLEKVANVPALTAQDLEKIKKKIGLVNSEVAHLVEQRMMASDSSDDKLGMFRQQAAIVAKKKEAAAEKLQEMQQQLQQIKDDLAEKRAQLEEQGGAEGTVRGDDFKQYVHQLRGKSAVYKKKRLEVGELRAEFGVLSRTLEILKGKDAIISNMVAEMERERGVTGISSTQEQLEQASESKASLDEQKGETLNDMSAMVLRLNEKIAQRKAKLAPIIKELRGMRQQSQEVTIDYEEKKHAYDSMAAGLESNNAKLESEVRDMKRELAESESRMHWLTAQREILEAQKAMAEQEAKLYTDKGKGKSRRDQLQALIAEQEKQSKILKEDHKNLKETSVGSAKQMQMWKDLLKLVEMKRQCWDAPKRQASAGRFQKESAGERLEL